MYVPGLFHKAISQSGVATNCWAFTEREPPSTNKGFQLAEKLGKATTDAKVAYEFLKKIDAKKLRFVEQKNLLTEIVSFFENFMIILIRLQYISCAHKVILFLVVGKTATSFVVHT